MPESTQVVSVKLEDGTVIHVEARRLQGEEQVASKIFDFDEVMHLIRGVASSLHETITALKPHKASIEFGVEAALEGGKLIALLVQGSGKANLKLTLEWGGSSQPRE